MNFTLEKIERLQSNEVFMFGSHINGQHCSGVTRTAYECFGNVLGLFWEKETVPKDVVMQLQQYMEIRSCCNFMPMASIDTD